MEIALRDVIKRDDTQKFRSLLYGKKGDFMMDDQYLTQICALFDSPGCMAVSIEMGAPINLEGNVMAPLNCSSFSGSVETAILLIEAGAKLNHIYNGETPIMLAVRYSTPEHVQLLLEVGSDPVDVEYAAKYSKSPDALLPFIDNGNKDDALESAVFSGKPDNVQALLRNGAKPSMMSLLTACSYNFYKIVKLILDFGIIPDDIAMQTCIYWNSIESLKVLIEWGLKPIPYDIHFSILHNKPQPLKVLIDYGGDIECELNGSYPIHVASRHGKIECLNILLDNNVKINSSDNLGCTAIHWASLRRNTDILNLLINKNVCININSDIEFLPCSTKPTSDWSAIHVSIEAKNSQALPILLKSGAKQIKMWDGRTPLHIALKNNRDDLIPILIENGADLHETDLTYQTPIEYALSIGREDMAKLIRQLAPQDLKSLEKTKEIFNNIEEKQINNDKIIKVEEEEDINLDNILKDNENEEDINLDNILKDNENDEDIDLDNVFKDVNNDEDIDLDNVFKDVENIDDVDLSKFLDDNIEDDLPNLEDDT